PDRHGTQNSPLVAFPSGESMPNCWIALGGNVGSVADTFDRSLELLRATVGVDVDVLSRIYQTQPVGSAAGSAYINATAKLVTDPPPLAVLDRLQTIESQLGRVRGPHWGPRTLDLDLLLYDSEIVTHPR